MPLSAGSTLGPYEVTAKIGAGGMGEVYRARDTKLDRDVALKVLPQAFTDDPDRLARFEREAKVLASLNHPNIGHIYGLEEAEGQRALVLELIEGPTLADRIAQGPIPVDEALPIAKQIAEALEAAHEQGIIHRDLKPANVKVKDDGTVKVLDFGLAKALDTTPQGDPSQSPTLTAAATQMGVIMGTAAYMSPEQAAGQTADTRSDVWSFGVVLYEMLTSQRLFTGETVSHVLAKVLDRELDFSALPTPTPAPIKRLLRRCLERKPKRRLGDVGEMLIHLEEAATTAAEEPSLATSVTDVTQPAGWRQALLLAFGMSVVAVVITGLAVWSVMRPGPSRVARFEVSPDDTLTIAGFSGDVAISSDGEHVAFVTGSSFAGDARQLHVRSLDQVSARLVAEGGPVSPFFSPDSQEVGFYDIHPTPSVLKRVSVRGGPASTIAELPGSQLRGASWGPDGTIVFASNDSASGLWQVSAVGGEPEQLTTPDQEQGEAAHRWPAILPGGEAVLFTIIANPVEDSQIAVLSLDTREQKVIVRGSHPRYAPTGHLVYGVEGNLWAVGFDLDRLEALGDAVPVVEGALTKASGAASFDLARDGSLVYVAGTSVGIGRTLVWVDREGREEALDAEAGDYLGVRVSPNGAHLALDFDRDVQTYDTVRGTFNRVTTDPGNDQFPIWTPDGTRLVFQSDRGGSPELFWTLADGTGTPEPIVSREGDLIGTLPEAWTPDGGTLLFTEVRAGVADIGTVSMEGDPTADLLIEDEFVTAAPTVSPDGRWLAYQSNLSGQGEIYVQRFPELGNRQRISTGGGRVPRWSPDGTELFYQSPGGRQLFAVPIVTEPAFTAGVSEVLFEGAYLAPVIASRRPYDLTPDGDRFVMIKSPASTSDADEHTQITWVQNWTEELTRLFPDP